MEEKSCFFGGRHNCNFIKPEPKKVNPVEGNKDIGFIPKEELARAKWLNARISFSSFRPVALQTQIKLEPKEIQAMCA